MPILCVPHKPLREADVWQTVLTVVPAITPPPIICAPNGAKRLQKEETRHLAGQLLLGVNRQMTKYRMFDEDGTGLDNWSEMNSHLDSNDGAYHLHHIILSKWDISHCKASADRRAVFFGKLIAAVHSIELTYPANDAVVCALLAGEAGEEVRRLVKTVIFGYRRGMLHTMMFEFFVGPSEVVDCKNPKLRIPVKTEPPPPPPSTASELTWPAEPTILWHEILDVDTGRLHRRALNDVLERYRHACRSEQAFVLQLPPIDRTLSSSSSSPSIPQISSARGRNDIRVWRADEVNLLFHDCGFSTPVNLVPVSVEDERRLAFAFALSIKDKSDVVDNEPALSKMAKANFDRCGQTFLLTCDARNADACLATLRGTGHLPAQHWVKRAPVNYTADFTEVVRARNEFGALLETGIGGGGGIAVRWSKMPLYEYRFYAKCAGIVEFVLALHALALPALVIDELLLWLAESGSTLLRAERMRTIESTQASCRRVLGARSASVVRGRKTNANE